MIPYIERTKAYYRAQGFEQDYQWAMNVETPFSRPARPLKSARITLVTTAVVEPSIPKPIRTAKSYAFSDAPADFDTAELSWDKITTHTNDRESYFPLQALNARVAAGEIGSLAPRFHFIPTEYSQRHTRNEDAPLITEHCLTDAVDLAILIPL
jgi:D-proline reductase (dithiol) PrdB